jgi:hypothetical protein
MNINAGTQELNIDAVHIAITEENKFQQLWIVLYLIFDILSFIYYKAEISHGLYFNEKLMLIQLQNSRIKVIYFQGFLWQIELEFSLDSQFQIHFRV